MLFSGTRAGANGEVVVWDDSAESSAAAPTRSPLHDVPSSDRSVFMAPIAIPRELAVNSTVQLAITVRDARLGRASQTTLSATVGNPRLCEVGKRTRKQYDAQIAELRATVASGDMAQAQLDRYDAELIRCLKRRADLASSQRNQEHR